MRKDQPWLSRKRWAQNRIDSSARHVTWFLWGFALLWNLLTLPLYFQAEDIWEKTQREPITALAVLFPLVGWGLLLAAVHATRRVRHFGRTPLVLDPFPGSLGGHVGGRIDTGIPFDPQGRFTVNLACLRSHVSGSGKNRSRRESVTWQRGGICHSERGIRGTRLSFRFDVPTDLPVSEPVSNNYHLWRVSVSAPLDGPDFDRHFDIPVYDTGAQPSSIRRGTETSAATVEAAMDGVNSVANILPIAGGIEASFPALQRPAQGIFCLLFGLVFFAVGVATGFLDVSLVFPLLFTPIGAGIAGYGVYYLGKSLAVSITTDGVTARRFLFSYPLRTRQLVAQDFKSFEIKKGATLQSGNKTTVYYRLNALGKQGQPLRVAERLVSHAEAEILKECYETYLGRA